MTIKGLIVHVYRAAQGGDCSRNGLTARVAHCILIDPKIRDGEVIEAKEGDEVLIVDYRQGYSHKCLTPCARPAKIINGEIVKNPGWHMFGGNYITGDSRFSDAHGHVLPVHDRCEQ